MDAPVRVLQVFGTLDRGGAETMIMNLYRNIDRTKVQFDFIVHTTKECAYMQEIRALGGKIFSVPKFGFRTAGAYRNAWNAFFKEHKEYKMIHSHVRSTAAIYLRIAKKYGLTTIAHSHNTSSGNGFSAAVKNILQYPIRFSADYLFACSRSAGEWLFGKKAVKKSNFKIICNAIDISKFSYDPAARKIGREQLNIDDKFVIGNVGRFHPQKNHSFLLSIFKAIHDKNSNAVLLLVGDGDLRPQIEKKIAELDLQDCVILAGVRSDIPQLLQAMDVFVFPSVYEGLPVSVIEAQAAGLPCFLSDVITKEVSVTSLVNYLPLQTETNIWADRILQFQNDYKRQNTCEQIQAAGYDIKEVCAWVENFYYNNLTN